MENFSEGLMCLSTSGIEIIHKSKFLPGTIPPAGIEPMHLCDAGMLMTAGNQIQICKCDSTVTGTVVGTGTQSGRRKQQKVIT